MGYSTRQELEDAAGGAHKLVQLTDLDGTGAEDAGLVDRAQAKADGWIDARLRLRYKVPIANPTTSLRELAAEETLFQLRRARGKFAITPEDLDQREKRRLELEEYRTGKLRPDDPAPVKSSAMKSAIVEIGGDVTRDTLKGQW